MTQKASSATEVPAHENCSRCGRPYAEHAHSGAEYIERSNAVARFAAHAFRRQPASRFYPEGLPHLGRREDKWSGARWWPDGRWDGSSLVTQNIPSATGGARA